MKKNYVLNHLLRTSASLAVVALSLTSCVDDTYDLEEKDIDLEIEVGSTVTLPLGESKAMVLGEMLDLEEIDELAVEDGLYKIVYSDNYTYDFSGLAGESGLTIAGMEKEQTINSNFSLSQSAPAFDAALAPVVNLYADLGESSHEVSNEVSISDIDVKRVDAIYFANPVYVTINFDATIGLDSNDAELSFTDYAIDFPEFLKFAEGTALESGNVMSFNDKFTRNGKRYTFTKRIAVDHLDFTGSAYDNLIVGEGDNRKLVISEEIALSGGVTLSGSDINLTNLDTSVEATMTFSLDDMQAGKIYGIVNPEIDLDVEEIDLKDLAEVFEGGDFKATLSDPKIKLDISNSVDIPVEISSLELQPSKGGVAMESIALTEPIKIARGSESAAAITSIVIVDSSAEEIAGVECVKVTNLKRLLAGCPDKIAVNYKAAVADDGKQHMVDLSRKSYEFGVDYALDIPLSFEELEIDYVSSGDLNFGDDFDMSEVTEYISKFGVKVKAESTLPIGVEIAELTPVDVDGNALALPSIIEKGKGVIAANGNSTLQLTLADNVAGDLARLAGFDIHIIAKGDASNGAIEIRENQYLKLSLSATVADGVHLDLNESDDDDE